MATMLSQKLVEAQEANDTVRVFMRRFEVGKLLSSCRAQKAKGFSVVELFVYLLSLMFSSISTYGEQYDWLASVFRDWAFTLMTATLYEIDRDRLDPMTLSLYQKGLMAFDGNTPTYHLELREHPTLVWDFHSLLLNVQLLISMSMTDEKNPLKICHKCQRPFFASKADAKYCSPECRDKARKDKGKK